MTGKRTIKKVGRNLQIKFDSQTFVPGFQSGVKTLKTNFKEGGVVKVNSASSGIGVTKDGVRECWINLCI